MNNHTTRLVRMRRQWDADDMYPDGADCVRIKKAIPDLRHDYHSFIRHLWREYSADHHAQGLVVDDSYIAGFAEWLID